MYISNANLAQQLQLNSIEIYRRWSDDVQTCHSNILSLAYEL